MIMMWLPFILAFFGGISYVAAAAEARFPRDVNETCAAESTVTTVQTVTIEPEIIIISVLNPDPAVSSIMSAFTGDTSISVSAHTSKVTTATETSGNNVVTVTQLVSGAPTSAAYSGPSDSNGLNGTHYPPGTVTKTLTIVPDTSQTSSAVSAASATPIKPSDNCTTIAAHNSTLTLSSSTTVTRATTTEVFTVVSKSSQTLDASTTCLGNSTLTSAQPYTSMVLTTLYTTVTLSNSTSGWSLTPSSTGINGTSGSGLPTSSSSVNSSALLSSFTAATVNTSSTSTRLLTTITVTHNQTTTSVASPYPAPSNTTSTALGGHSTSNAASTVTAYGYGKRSVCELITATESNGIVITFPNAWDGSTYVPTCSNPILSPETSPITTYIRTTLGSSSSVPTSTLGQEGPTPSIFSSSTSTTLIPLYTNATVSSSLASATSASGYSTSSSFVTSIIPTSPSTYGNTTITSATGIRPTATSDNCTTSSTATPPTQTCGEIGTFTLTFDDLPSNGSPSQYPPIFSPYNHFTWSDGWYHVPPPTDRFAPHDGSHLAMYIPTPADSDEDPFAFTTYGYFSAGAVAPLSDTTYWFNANTAWAGCDNGPWNNGTNDGTQECIISAQGFHYNVEVLDNEIQVADFTWSIPPCNSTSDCTLTQIDFDNEFRELSALAFQATVGSQIVAMYFDGFVGTWWNNTCAAGQARAITR